ncbi:MAG: nucleotidyltransferase domain-containing protein [Bacteroidetes bacterium]|nr:nucleotidyltransferase domain-containing protein [Bacteroidota bacterium]
MLLRDKDKETLCQIFSELTIPVEVWAYGSRVKGAAHQGSDLDLVIRSQKLTPISYEIYTGLCEKIKESNIPILVELRDWAMLPQSFHSNIEEHYEVLFDNKNSYNLSPKKHILNEPDSDYKVEGKEGENEK